MPPCCRPGFTHSLLEQPDARKRFFDRRPSGARWADGAAPAPPAAPPATTATGHTSLSSVPGPGPPGLLIRKGPSEGHSMRLDALRGSHPYGRDQEKRPRVLPLATAGSESPQGTRDLGFPLMRRVRRAIHALGVRGTGPRGAHVARRHGGLPAMDDDTQQMRSLVAAVRQHSSRVGSTLSLHMTRHLPATVARLRRGVERMNSIRETGNRMVFGGIIIGGAAVSLLIGMVVGGAFAGVDVALPPAGQAPTPPTIEYAAPTSSSHHGTHTSAARPTTAAKHAGSANANGASGSSVNAGGSGNGSSSSTSGGGGAGGASTLPSAPGAGGTTDTTPVPGATSGTGGGTTGGGSGSSSGSSGSGSSSGGSGSGSSSGGSGSGSSSGSSGSGSSSGSSGSGSGSSGGSSGGSGSGGGGNTLSPIGQVLFG